MNELEPIALSALQHWAYCPRQCGLIHLEQAFDDNLHTLRGNAVHARVDKPVVETAKGVRVERALPLWNDELGLIGKLRAEVRHYPRGAAAAKMGAIAPTVSSHARSPLQRPRPSARQAGLPEDQSRHRGR